MRLHYLLIVALLVTGLSSCFLLGEIGLEVFAADGAAVMAGEELAALSALEIAAETGAASISEAEAGALLSDVRIARTAAGEQRLIARTTGKYLGDLENSRTIRWNATGARTVLKSGKFYRINARSIGVRSQLGDLNVKYNLEQNQLVILRSRQGQFAQVLFPVGGDFELGWVLATALTPSDTQQSHKLSSKTPGPKKSQESGRRDCEGLRSGSVLFSGSDIDRRITIYEWEGGKNGSVIRSFLLAAGTRSQEYILPEGAYNWEATQAILTWSSLEPDTKAGSFYVARCKTNTISVLPAATNSSGGVRGRQGLSVDLISDLSAGKACFRNSTGYFVSLIYQKNEPYSTSNRVEINANFTFCSGELPAGEYSAVYIKHTANGDAQYHFIFTIMAGVTKQLEIRF